MQYTIFPADGMVAKNGVWRKVDLSGIDPEIHAVQYKDGYGEIEYTTKDKPNLPFEDENLFAEVLASWELVQLPVEQEDPRASMNVSRFQALAAMYNAGILPQVEAYFSNGATNDVQKLAWKNAATFYRLSPLVEATGTALGLTEEQLDDLFTSAAVITI